MNVNIFAIHFCSASLVPFYILVKYATIFAITHQDTNRFSLKYAPDNNNLVFLLLISHYLMNVVIFWKINFSLFFRSLDF